LVNHPIYLRNSSFAAPQALEGAGGNTVNFSAPQPGIVKGTVLSIRTTVTGNGPKISTTVVALGPPDAPNKVPIP